MAMIATVKMTAIRMVFFMEEFVFYKILSMPNYINFNPSKRIQENQ